MSNQRYRPIHLGIINTFKAADAAYIVNAAHVGFSGQQPEMNAEELAAQWAWHMSVTDYPNQERDRAQYSDDVAQHIQALKDNNAHFKRKQAIKLALEIFDSHGLIAKP